LDYRVFLTELAKLPPDMPVLLEHMTSPEDYQAGADFIRKIAAETGTILR